VITREIVLGGDVGEDGGDDMALTDVSRLKGALMEVPS
jgi:hypothetical protein